MLKILRQETLWPAAVPVRPRVTPFQGPATDPWLSQTVGSVDHIELLPGGFQRLPLVSLTSIMLLNPQGYLFKYRLLHVEAYVHALSQNKVIFKLTPKTMMALIKYHEEVYCVGVAANVQFADDMAITRLKDKFVEAVHGFVHETHSVALEKLEEDGSGEICCVESNEAKNNIMSMFRIDGVSCG